MFNPIDNKIIVRPEEKEEKVGSIYIPTAHQAENYFGEVVAVGPGLMVDGKRVPLQVQVGDTVYYPTFAGTKVTIDKVEHVIMPESALHGFTRA